MVTICIKSGQLFTVDTFAHTGPGPSTMSQVHIEPRRNLHLSVGVATVLTSNSKLKD